MFNILDWRFVQSFLAEGEETAADKRVRLSKEAEERDRRRQMGEEEWMKQVIII